MANRLVSVNDTYDFPLPVRNRLTATLVDPAVSGEATTRADADAALDGRIGALEAVDPLTQAEGDARYHPLTTDLATQVELDTEVTARTDADAALDTRLGSVESTLPTKADLVGGVVPTNQMPSISIMNRVPVADEAARLALINPDNVQVGDVAVQADTGTTWLLIDADPTLAASWKAIDQSDAVQSVNNQTGTVVLAKADVGLGSVDNTADLDKPVSSAQQTALNAKAPVASPALTGTPTAPTPPAGDDATNIATTAFVQSEIVASVRTPVGSVAYLGVAQSIPDNVSTEIEFDVERDDEPATWLSAGRLVIPASISARRFTINAAASFAANATGDRVIELKRYVTGATPVTETLRRSSDSGLAGTERTIECGISVVLAPGDEVFMEVIQTSGLALDIQGGGPEWTFLSLAAY